VIVTHGFLTNKYHPALTTITSDLIGAGYSTFRFDFTGCGESEGRWSFSVKQQVEDIKKVVEHFARYREVVLVGGSYSALPAAIAAYSTPKIVTLVNVNGFYGLPPKDAVLRLIHLGLRFGARFWRRLQVEFEYVEEMFKPDKIKIPVLLLCSSMDEVIDSHDSEAFYLALQTKKKLVRLDNGDHEITQPELLKQAVATFKSWDREVKTSSY
jgi:uncharacterized protein